MEVAEYPTSGLKEVGSGAMAGPAKEPSAKCDVTSGVSSTVVNSPYYTLILGEYLRIGRGSYEVSGRY